MLTSIKICLAEIKKQYLNYNKNWQSYISLGLWPFLNIIVAYYTYYSFDISILKNYGINGISELLVFILTGLLGYNSFWSMVQSAMYIQNERENGTLEITFLTPASRMGFIYGRALGGLFQSIWIFSVFTLIITIFNVNFTWKLLYYIPLSYLILFISATIWGGFINSIFLISRDVSFWFTLCDEPMLFLSGAKFPIVAFSTFIKSLSAIFPLTHCLAVIRYFYMENSIKNQSFILLFIILGVLILVTYILIKKAEKNNRINGQFQFY